MYHDWVLFSIFGIGLPLVYTWLAFPIVVRAMRTGELEIRGRSYARAEAPRQYWLGLALGVLVLATAAGTALTILAVIISRVLSS
jgi:hypothetical protein